MYFDTKIILKNNHNHTPKQKYQKKKKKATVRLQVTCTTQVRKNEKM
jgi:hypothetical protein